MYTSHNIHNFQSHYQFCLKHESNFSDFVLQFCKNQLWMGRLPIIETYKFSVNKILNILQRPYEVKITNQTTYSVNRNILVNSSLNADGSVDVDMELLASLPELNILCELYLDSGYGKYEMQIVNRTVSVCRLIREPRYEPLVQIVYKIILQYGNFPRKCPMPKVSRQE